MRNGKWIYYYDNGDRYEGDWRNDKAEGKRIYYFNNGDRYEGDYRNDKKEGKEIYYYTSGNRYEGDWRKEKIKFLGPFLYLNNFINLIFCKLYLFKNWY